MKFLGRSLAGLFIFGLTVALLAAAGGILLSGVQQRMSGERGERPARERVFAVNVVPVTPGKINPVISVFGEVKSARSLDLRAPASGTIIYVSENFIEGGYVEEGETLLKIDPTAAKDALNIARTNLREARAELEEAEFDLDITAKELRVANQQAALHKKALERQRTLLEKGAGTEVAVEGAELAAANAEQAVLAKQRALSKAKTRASNARTLLERREIALSEAERSLAETEQVAEFTGRLTEVSVVKGGLINKNERTGRLIDPESLEVSFRVSNAQYRRLIDETGNLLSSSASFRLEVDGLDLTASGEIVREAAAVGEGQTGRLLFARIESGKDSGFRAGDFVTAMVQEPALRGVAEIPTAALDSDGGVLALGGENRLEGLKVEVLRRQGDTSLVRGREAFGREIVAERSALLGEGIKVRPIKAGAPQVEEPETVTLEEGRRQELIAFVRKNGFMPDDVKSRIIEQLGRERVPARVVERLESRMGS